MKYMLKKTICTSIALFMLFSFSCNADIIDNSQNPETNVVTEYYSDELYDDFAVSVASIPVSSPPVTDAKSVILIEQSTGRVLYEKNADEKLSPASITKIMTMLLVCEAIDSGRLKFTDRVTISEHAASMGGSQIWLEPKETMSVKDLLMAVAVGSANDASVALAEQIAGSEEGFVTMMNERATHLKMKNTVFKNACGLDDDGHISSAKDVAIMSRELLKHNLIRPFTSTWMSSLRGDTTQLVNTNKLVRFYLGATGLKTGTTDKAGFCLSASAKRDNMELIAVIMHAQSSNERFSAAKKLLDYGFANWSVTTPTYDKSKIKSLPVTMGQGNAVMLAAEKILPELVPKGSSGAVKVVIELPKCIEAPIEKNQQVGKIKIYSGDKQINEYSVYAKTSVKHIDFGFVFGKLLYALCKK